METKYNTSFIPKKFLGDSVGGGSGGSQYVSRRSVMGPGYYISVLVFVLALIGAGGIFAYVKVKQQEIDAVYADLKGKTESITQEELKNLIRLDSRLTGATQAVTDHKALSSLFEALEANTLTGIQYLTLQYGGEGGGGMTVSLSGKARDFQQVALQAKQFQESGSFHAPRVTDLAYGDDGNTVEFGMEVGVSPLLISFGSSLQRGSTARPSTPAPAAPPVEEVQPEQQSETLPPPPQP